MTGKMKMLAFPRLTCLSPSSLSLSFSLPPPSRLKCIKLKGTEERGTKHFSFIHSQSVDCLLCARPISIEFTYYQLLSDAPRCLTPCAQCMLCPKGTPHWGSLTYPSKFSSSGKTLVSFPIFPAVPSAPLPEAPLLVLYV